MANITIKAPKLNIIRPEVADVYFAKKVEENGVIKFEKIEKGFLDTLMYVIIETNHIEEGFPLKVNVFQYLEKDGEVCVHNTKKEDLIAKVGIYKEKGGTTTQAIAEIMLGLDNRDDSFYYIFSKENRLYVTLSIEANNDGKSDKTICYNLKEYKYNYTDDPNFWYRKNRFELEETPAAPWMEIAWEEYHKWKNGNWTEKGGKGFDIAQEYINITGENFSPIKAAWCACFVDWVLKQTNLNLSVQFSTVELNPASSQNYRLNSRYPNSQIISPSLNKPPYGVFAVLHSSGWSGHIGFVVNFVTKENKNYIHILGGNQNDKVCVQEFEVFENKGNIIFKTKKGSKYTLKGYVYPKEYNLPKSLNYKTNGYEVESAISTI